MKVIISVSFASLMLTAQAAQTPAGPAVQPGAASISPTNGVGTPLSVFVNPHSQQEGRDPFFPTSLRPYATPVVTPANTNLPQPIILVELHLKGISGSAEHRLAIINNHTFETGEEAEVSSNNGRVRIRCLEIRPDSVLIQTPTDRRELRLRAGV